MTSLAIRGSLRLRSEKVFTWDHGPKRWLFMRDHQAIELEARRDGVNHYVAAVRWPNKTEEVRQFSSVDAIRQHPLGLSRQ